MNLCDRRREQIRRDRKATRRRPESYQGSGGASGSVLVVCRVGSGPPRPLRRGVGSKENCGSVAMKPQSKTLLFRRISRSKNCFDETTLESAIGVVVERRRGQLELVVAFKQLTIAF
jgi:hypothetical protein